jgi:tetratricopeptide (TPR) repeat protein
MKKSPMKYNPAFLSQEELECTFVVRQVDLELLVETINENTEKSNQHVLVVGSQGLGKTMLVLRTASYVKENEELNSKWYPLVLNEESYEILTASEFWLCAVFHLAKQENDDSLMMVHEELKKEKDERRLYERALACLMDFSDSKKKRILLIVENLNLLFQDQIKDENIWEIRHTLLNESRLMLLSTAKSRFNAIDDSSRAMYDLFKIHYLEPLNSEEIQALWESLTGKKLKKNRVRPLQILAGGNPRLITIIASFPVNDSIYELKNQLTLLIDEYTSYFKSIIESLPVLERKIFITLANIWEPATASQISKESRIDVNKTSSLLLRLESRGAVTIIKTKGQKNNYQLSQRLFNIYHLMRSKGSRSDRVKALVDFMINFYDGEERVHKLSQLPKEALKIEHPKNGFKGMGDLDLNKYVLSSEDVETWYQLAQFYTKAKKFHKAEKAYRKAIELSFDHVASWIRLGLLLQFNQKKYTEAKLIFLEALELFPDNSELWARLGQIYQELEQYSAAEEAFRKSLSINTEELWVWTCLGELLQKNPERYPEAEEIFEKVIAKEPEEESIWGSLLAVQIQQGYNKKKLLDTITRGIKLTKGMPFCLSVMALAIIETNYRKGFSKAEELSKQALEQKPNGFFFQYTYAAVLGALKKWEQALSIAEQFLNNPDSKHFSSNFIITFFIDAAYSNSPAMLLTILENSLNVFFYEPLITALKILAGVDYCAPIEVVEVAKDIMKKINEKTKRN